MAMLVALSLILVMLINFPILPAIPFMKYDPADIPILIGSFLFGPMGGVILTAIVSILQGLFISGDGGPIGIVMHFLATGTFAFIAGFIYQRTKTKRSAVVGLICGALSMTCVMVICNLLLTPIFLGAPMEKVIELLLPAIIPFNIKFCTSQYLKGALILTVITTIRKVTIDLENKAKQIAKDLSIPYVTRNNLGIDKIKQQENTNTVIVVKKDKLVLDLPTGEMFFHPNMAQVRMKRLRCGDIDNMLEAMGGREFLQNKTVLDCTLGFASDAIISSYGVGPKGKVIGLEVNPLIALIVKDGLKTYLPTNYDLKSAMDNITVINQDYLSFLKEQEDNSFDVIYFDPMFRHALTDSKSLNPLRQLADMRAVSHEALNEAKRVAKYRIVFKENSRSLEFSRLGFTKICGGKYAPIHYGVIDLN